MIAYSQTWHDVDTEAPSYVVNRDLGEWKRQIGREVLGLTAYEARRFLEGRTFSLGLGTAQEGQYVVWVVPNDAGWKLYIHEALRNSPYLTVFPGRPLAESRSVLRFPVGPPDGTRIRYHVGDDGRFYLAIPPGEEYDPYIIWWRYEGPEWCPRPSSQR